MFSRYPFFVEVSDLLTSFDHVSDAFHLTIAPRAELTEDCNQVLFPVPTWSFPQMLHHERLSPDEQIH